MARVGISPLNASQYHPREAGNIYSNYILCQKGRSVPPSSKAIPLT
nr:MAG TPA: hypothetical protein [Caudoviricetes sp.]